MKQNDVLRASSAREHTACIVCAKTCNLDLAILKLPCYRLIFEEAQPRELATCAACTKESHLAAFAFDLSV